MKNIFKNIVLIAGLSALFVLNACKEKIDPVIEELAYSRAFTPVGLKAAISNVTIVTLSWTAVKNTDHYVVETYQGTDFTAANLINTANVTGGSLIYSLPAGDTQFSSRVKSVSSVQGVAESNWTSVTFKSDPENLFNTYTSEMSGLGSCTIRWKPGTVATSLLFTVGTTNTPFTLSAAEITAGAKDVTGLSKGTFQVSLMNGTFTRGKTSITIEGDVMVNSGGDLAAAITAATTGSVILLQNGASFGIAGNYTLNKSLKIRGVYKTNLPTIYPSTGASTTAGFFLIDPAVADSIVFQNLILTGNINNVAGSMITGVYDQGTTNACNIGTLKFKSCLIQHFSRHLIRLRGTASQVINSFEVEDCILNDYGTNSFSYGIISSNTTAGKINNIKFSNSTMYNCLSYIILYTNATACQGITIQNCTINQTVMDPGTAGRYFIDVNATVSTGPINISNCVIGLTSATATGIRQNTMIINMTNCYYTSDYADGTLNSIKTKMTAYSGASTGLWTDPVNGIFTFKDATFAGKSTTGDPRWR